VTKDNLKVEKLTTRKLPPPDPETVTTTLDVPIRKEARRVVSEDYERFESMMKRLVSVSKKEIDARREAEHKRP
jgi:hypothetical protein